jgi:tetratricopeptide (TPR) repeat protein
LSANPSLLSIIAHARSGALDYAWRLLRDAGLDCINDDPAVLSVVGRLLKDQALTATGEERQRLYLEAATAYTRAGEISGATYPLINAATLSLLAGRREQAQTLARLVLLQNQRGKDELETPYYRAATRAEALLLLGDFAQAKAAFAEAMSLAPRAFEDHASTLRQFGLILDELGEDRLWLEPYRPPRSLHYAGHMTMAAEGDAIGQLIRSVTKEERIGFGYGALAAGADILIAEVLLEEGAELHLLLPAEPARFREASVARFGDGWVTRFDHILESADSIRSVGTCSDPSSPLALQLAAEVAMGCAVMQANVLMTEAIQLLILDRNTSAEGEVGGSNWICSAWEGTGRRQHVLAAPRVRAEADVYARDDASSASNCLAAMLRIEWSDADTKLLSGEIIPRLAGVFASGATPLIAPRWTSEALLVAFHTPAHAARAALSAIAALAGVADLRIAGHYGIALRVDDPFGGAPLLLGPATALPGRIALSTPPGAVHLTEDFAAALYAGSVLERPRIEYVGELPIADADGPVRLFALTH